MDNFNIPAVGDLLNDITYQVRSWYHDPSVTAGGLAVATCVICAVLVPLLMLGFEWYFGIPGVTKKHLPRASSNLPIPEPIKIRELRVYPIKSCRGFIVEKARVLETGLELDRNWMFVDAKEMTFCTIRQVSKMTLINTKLLKETDELEISIDSKENIKFAIPAHPTKEWLEKNTELSECHIWSKPTDGYVYPTSLTAPISKFLEKEVRLVYKGPTTRLLPAQARPEVLGRIGSTKFADFMPVQVANQRSIEELNSRLREAGETEITIEHFRPNIIVEGTEPWYEDTWKTIRTGFSKEGQQSAGSVTFDIPVRCARCQVPNVNPDTGEKNKTQPWNTLMKYRRVDKGINFKPCFGMLCVPRGEGVVERGMRFEVLEVTEEHNWKGALEDEDKK